MGVGLLLDRLDRARLMTTKALKGKVALVAGATRGGGRGIACALGEQGAMVYCTGRSTQDHAATAGRSETIEGTATRVSELGGEGRAVPVDHADRAAVAALVARLQEEEGGVDLFVNSVWGGDALTEWNKPFWELDLDKGRQMFETAYWSHVESARLVAPLLLGRENPLMVEVVDGDGFGYRGNVFYDLVKTGLIRLAFALSVELRSKGVSAVAVTPGFLRSEAMLDHFGVSSETWREGIAKDPDFAASESPLFVGRAVAALAGDPEVKKKTGRVYASWTLAKEYGFTDVDGSRPDWGHHFRAKYGAGQPPADEGFYAYWKSEKESEG